MGIQSNEVVFVRDNMAVIMPADDFKAHLKYLKRDDLTAGKGGVVISDRMSQEDLAGIGVLGAVGIGAALVAVVTGSAMFMNRRTKNRIEDLARKGLVMVRLSDGGYIAGSLDLNESSLAWNPWPWADAKIRSATNQSKWVIRNVVASTNNHFPTGKKAVIRHSDCAEIGSYVEDEIRAGKEVLNHALRVQAITSAAFEDLVSSHEKWLKEQTEKARTANSEAVASYEAKKAEETKESAPENKEEKKPENKEVKGFFNSLVEGLGNMAASVKDSLGNLSGPDKAWEEDRGNLAPPPAQQEQQAPQSNSEEGNDNVVDLAQRRAEEAERRVTEAEAARQAMKNQATVLISDRDSEIAQLKKQLRDNSREHDKKMAEAMADTVRREHLTEDACKARTISELRAMCEVRGVEVTNNKARKGDIISLLLEAQANGSQEQQAG